MNQDEKGRIQQTHGIYAFSDRGPDALTPERNAYLTELKRKFSTNQGRAEYRADLAAALGTIVEMGFSTMRQDAEAKKDIWAGGVVGKLGIYVNALIRLLDNWPDDIEKPRTIIDALRGSDE
jgi:hypothetical protein